MDSTEDLCNNIKAILRELESQDAPNNKGILRWTVHKNVEADPSSSVFLVSVLVKELEEAYRADCKVQIIPLLQTLCYVVIQSGVLPASLYQSVYGSIKNLLSLPQPYSAVALRNLQILKKTMTTPGVCPKTDAIRRRSNTAEQPLKSLHSTVHERVFVLADPAVFSAPLESLVRADLETPNGVPQDTMTSERTAVLHTLQKGLGPECQSPALAQALQTLEKREVHKYAQEVGLAIEKSTHNDTLDIREYQEQLQHIYEGILTAAKRATDHHGYFMASPLLPIKNINFCLWNNEEELWSALDNFMMDSCDEDKKERRESLWSVDSGIVRDLRDLDLDVQTTLTSGSGFGSSLLADQLALMWEHIVASSSNATCFANERKYAAYVVVMGDDRALGRLAKFYLAFREKETTCLTFTSKLNLQFYYIPVTDQHPDVGSHSHPSEAEGKLSLASLLGRVDPWYNSNIISLGAVIPELAERQSNQKTSAERNHFILDVLSYYLHCGMQPVHLPLYSVKLTFSCDGRPEVDEVFVTQLHAEFPEYRQLKQKVQEGPTLRRRRKSKPIEIPGGVISVSYKKVSVSKRVVKSGMAPSVCVILIKTVSGHETAGQNYLSVSFDTLSNCPAIQTQSISIKTLEGRTLTVCLDVDSRRTYENVQRLDISPCVDPVYSMQSLLCMQDKQDTPLGKYLNKVLSLSINTFTGVTH